ncbi:MAG: glycosyltransferase family 39 protein [Anaerolineae bacterium]
MTRQDGASRAHGRFWTAALLALCLLAFALRMYRLEAQSLWYDEGVTAYLATLSLPDLTAWTADDIQPPLYYYAVWGWVRLAGAGEFALRFPSAFAGVLLVPCLAWVGRRVAGSRGAGLLAALLGAVSPLHLWYAQEARNYTWVTLLCLAASGLFWACLREGRARAWRAWLPYVALMGAAVYTHYFAFFVLAFHACFALAWGLAGRRGDARVVPATFARAGQLWQALGAVAAVVAIYLPWLPFLVQRWHEDTSYWPGTLKLDEAARKVALAFLGGESILEAEGMRLLTPYLAVLALAAGIWAWRAARGRGDAWGLGFSLLYGAVPVALLLGLAYRVPKFNPRYAMVASPGALLLLAGAAAGKGRAPGEGWARAVAAAGLAFVLGVAGYADRNLYADPAFTKPDFRGVAQFVREHAAPDEAILLVSGHMAPVWDVYWPGSRRVPIPPLRILDARHPLGWEAAESVNRATAGKRGAWLVLWQDEVVDPTGVVAYMLERWGEPLPVGRTFWHVGLRHYALPEGFAVPLEPAIQHPVAVDFGGRLEFLGWDQERPGHVAAYWRAKEALSADWTVALTLRDAEGLAWGREDRRPTAFTYPAFRWEVGRVVLAQYALPAEPGTPPGPYSLCLKVYADEAPDGLDVLDAAGAPAGKEACVGPMEVGPEAGALAPERLPIPTPARADVGGLRFLGAGLEPASAQGGAFVEASLFWQVQGRPEPGLALRLAWEQGGRVLAEETRPLAGPGREVGDWPPGHAFRTRHRVRVPLQAQEGEVRLQAWVEQGGQPLTPAPLDLGAVRVLPTARVFAPPSPQVPLRVRFGEGILLLGADLHQGPARPGGVLTVTLYWQAVGEMDRSYTAFVHLLGPDGRVRAGVDRVPGGGARPTNTWFPPEVVAEEYALQIPDEAGVYSLEMGWYDAERPGMPRLPAVDEDGQTLGDRALLGPVEVRER